MRQPVARWLPAALAWVLRQEPFPCSTVIDSATMLLRNHRNNILLQLVRRTTFGASSASLLLPCASAPDTRACPLPPAPYHVV